MEVKSYEILFEGLDYTKIAKQDKLADSIKDSFAKIGTNLGSNNEKNDDENKVIKPIKLIVYNKDKGKLKEFKFTSYSIGKNKTIHFYNDDKLGAELIGTAYKKFIPDIFYNTKGILKLMSDIKNAVYFRVDKEIDL